MGSSIQAQIAQLTELDHHLPDHDYLLTWELSPPDLHAILKTAAVLRELRRAGRPVRLFDSGLAVSYFRDLSTRTRYSFAAAADALGLQVMGIDERSIQAAHGETTRETAVMLGWLTEVVGIRDDIYLGHGHRFIQEYAASLTQSVAEGVLCKRPTIVNLQSDLDHPTQSMSDLAHLATVFGGLDQLAGKRIAVTWAYSPSYGKPLSVSQGLIGLLSRFGMDISLAHPPGYSLLPEIVALARDQSTASGGRFEAVDSMDRAFEGAHAVYPKSWAPMAVLEERSALLEGSSEAQLAELERRCLAQNARHQGWECSAEKMDLTAARSGLYMHCLPADISGLSCAAGEVSDEVFSRYRRQTYAQAGWKPDIIAAVILLSRAEEPSGFLSQCAEGL